MLKDSADTSEEALNGSWWNEDTSPEYGVASAAAHALAALKSWPEDLQTDCYRPRNLMASRSSYPMPITVPVDLAA